MGSMANNQTPVRVVSAIIFVGSILALGQAVTTPGLALWYQTLVLPSYTPPGMIIGAVWTTLYALLAAAIVLSWNATGKKFLRDLAPLYLVNGALNVMWSVVFFGMHDIPGAAITAAVLTFSTAILLVANLKASKLAAALLIPYVLWAGFATVLNTHIAVLNVAQAPVILPLPDNQDDTVVTADAVTVTLFTGAKKDIDSNLSLTLKTVNDSRCPVDVQCIWQGELSFEIEADLKGKKADIRLGTVTVQDTDVGEYHLTLVDGGLESAKIRVNLP